MFVAGNAQAGKDCEAKYQHNSYVNPNWQNLGEVSGGGKK